jgi:hypothetical protein
VGGDVQVRLLLARLGRLGAAAAAAAADAREAEGQTPLARVAQFGPVASTADHDSVKVRAHPRWANEWHG